MTETSKYSVMIQVHHIDENRDNNNINNLCVLCPNCHIATHKGIYDKLKRINGELFFLKNNISDWKKQLVN